jgi:hypothetical protein
MADLLLVEQKPDQGREHPLSQDATIGREGCDIELSDPEASRRHAMVRREGEAVLIEDLGSTNGTFVNGERVAAPRKLSEGDEVRIGETVWRLQPPAGATKVAQPIEKPDVTVARPVAEQPPAPAAPPEPETRPEPARRPAAAQAPAAQAPAQPGSRRGDVPAPDFAPSAIRRAVPAPGTPGTFSPGGTQHRRGSAATRLEATVMATIVIALTAAGVIIYYLAEPFK